MPTPNIMVDSNSSSNAIKLEGGVLDGSSPIVYNPNNPISLFIVQAGIIIISCHLLHLPLSKLRQPRVISEVIGGIILGPSVLMRIPGFEATIFPAESIPNLNLVANIGLILFLFLVGLEVEMRMFLTNWRLALSVGVASMVLPFGLGCAISWGLFQEFDTEFKAVKIGVFMLFVGTAFSITAFPVLCRILTELKLISSPVGITVLAAGVANDVTGWILLALCIALINNGSGMSALYVLLCCIGWLLFLVFAIRPVFIWLLRRSGAFQNGPNQSMIMITLLLVFLSSWFTGIIGVHAIFGAFLVGLICPREGGFAVKVTEKIEDLVSVIFLPLYFALSGLSTNLALLNNGITWAYVIGVIVVAFFGKIIGSTLAARAFKMRWRESLTVGVLMSCKGLVEIIVLNIGLQANILSTKIFTIFVLMALVTTVTTTPLAMSLYPPHYQRRLKDLKFKNSSECERNPSRDESIGSQENLMTKQIVPAQKLLVYLRQGILPGLFTFIALLGGDKPTSSVKKIQIGLESLEDSEPKIVPVLSEYAMLKKPLELHGLHLLELTDRTSSVMQGSMVGERNYRDPVLDAFLTFARLHNFAASGTVSLVSETEYSETLIREAENRLADLILIPWCEASTLTDTDAVHEGLSCISQDASVRKTLEVAPKNIAIFINQGLQSQNLNSVPLLAPIVDWSHHVVLPFFGGRDDQYAFRFILQLAQCNCNTKVSIIHLKVQPSQHHNNAPSEISHEISNMEVNSTQKPKTDAISNEASVTDDTVFLKKHREMLPKALSERVEFFEVKTTSPLSDCISHVKLKVGNHQNAGDIVICGRKSLQLRFKEDFDFPNSTYNPELRKTLGIVAESLISISIPASLLVFQSSKEVLDSKPT